MGKQDLVFLLVEDNDQIKSDNLGVNACCIVKPMSFKKLSATIRTLSRSWDLAQIPQDA